MSIPEWFSILKDKFTDAASFAVAARHIELLGEHVELLKSQVEILSANAAKSEGELVAKAAELAVAHEKMRALVEENARYHENEKFDVVDGVAFERDEKNGRHKPQPRCPNCHRYLGFDPEYIPVDYACTCGHKAKSSYPPEDLMKKLKKLPHARR